MIVPMFRLYVYTLPLRSRGSEKNTVQVKRDDADLHNTVVGQYIGVTLFSGLLFHGGRGGYSLYLSK